ncbi:interleukin-1 receptor type 2 [Eucyclogobius newberryi]|uniref:interleukin-1 receptor type 2 n=1 Tax=Eucyclogobius newberryi TaxID=166745 RepID=UPI003B58EC39
MLLWLSLCVVPCLSGMPRPPALPPLPVQDGCLVMSPEVELFRVEGEAVILSFPFLHNVLKDRRMSLSGASILVSKSSNTNSSAHNNTNSSAHNTEGRILQQGAQLWLLPAQESDSGQYSCTYRTETFCARGRLTLQVYSSPFAHMDKLRYAISVSEGESLSFRCPSLSVFNRTETRVHWDKVSGAEATFSSAGGRLVIPAVHRKHSGLYMCQATVVVRQRPFRVSRAILITVQENPQILPSDLPMTPDPGLTTTEQCFDKKKYAKNPAPPVILSPVNGTIFEHVPGSSLELFCTVLTDCPMAESTTVTWLVNDQSVESSYLDERALQGRRRVEILSEGCNVVVRLMILEMRQKDTEAELKCFAQNQYGRQEVDVRLQLEDSTHTWMVVSCVTVLCLLCVVSVFLCVLFRTRSSRPKLDYTLARQNSSFLTSDLS